MTEDLWKSEKFIFVSKMANLWNKVAALNQAPSVNNIHEPEIP
jgi:hypothetical protein